MAIYSFVQEGAKLTAKAVGTPVAKGATLTLGLMAIPKACLLLAGFSNPGIVAGSYAACWMSSGALPGLLAVAQSAGAAGLSYATYGALGAGGAYLSKKLFTSK